MKKSTKENEFLSAIVLTELSVVLASNPNDPSILNPDFLRHNNIVDGTFKPTEPPISTPVFSRVSFQNGLVVQAEPSRMNFAQTSRPGQPLTESCISPDVAKRFVEKIPQNYTAIGINPKGYIPQHLYSGAKVRDTLIKQGTWLSFQDVLPEVRLTMTYFYNKSKRISMEVSGTNPEEGGSSKSGGILFQANIHRDILPSPQSERIKRILSILSTWKNDLSNFYELVVKFNPKEFTP